MILLAVLFWLLAAFVAYTYLLYPLLLRALAHWRRPRARSAPLPGSVSVILAVHNEAHSIGRRLQELTGLLRTSGIRGEIIVVSDGSTDGTVAAARSFPAASMRVLELPQHQGKAAALSLAAAAAQHEILVFADARQSWAPDALCCLLENFRDPTVGAVSGDLVVEAAPGVLAGVGLYWRYEKWLRQLESQVHSTVGVTGAISAVRRDLFRPIPAGTLLDDVYWPLCVAMQGFRVVHDNRARAYDRLPALVRDEFRRKVRTLSGNYQLLTRLPSVLLPWRNPLWFQFLSHKIFRLLVPWALLGMIAASALLPGPAYQAAFGGQVLFYLVGLLGIRTGIGARLRLAAAVGSFVVLNAAAWLAWWNWLSGRAAQSWGKVVYQR